MTKSFEDALKGWALKYLNEEAKRLDAVEVTKAEVRKVEASGYCETCYDDEHLDIDIVYKNSAGEIKDFWDYDYSYARVSQFELLQDLFKED